VRSLESLPVTLAEWRPDSAGLMAVTDDGLIYYPVDGQPVHVDSTAAVEAGTELGWVWP
jgi:hypothetical protein